MGLVVLLLFFPYYLSIGFMRMVELDMAVFLIGFVMGFLGHFLSKVFLKSHQNVGRVFFVSVLLLAYWVWKTNWGGYEHWRNFRKTGILCELYERHEIWPKNTSWCKASAMWEISRDLRFRGGFSEWRLKKLKRMRLTGLCFTLKYTQGFITLKK